MKVMFGSAPAQVSAVEDGKISAKVPLEASKSGPVRVEVNGLPSAELPFLCLPSVKLSVGKNPLGEGESTTGRFQIFHEDKPVTLTFKNASPDIVTFPGGEEQTVQSTGGADNRFEFAIQGLAGNRSYSINYNWGAKIAEIIEWKLPWTQVEWTAKEPPK